MTLPGEILDAVGAVAHTEDEIPYGVPEHEDREGHP